MNNNTLNIPVTDKKRVVIIGAGFGGLEVATKLKKSNYQVVFIDRHNFHQFQPLYYQVAMAGLEPSSISFPLRKVFQKSKHIHIRVANFEKVDTVKQVVITDKGTCTYDKLILAMGATTNYFGNKKIQQNVFPLKSIEEALSIRNSIFKDYEAALLTQDYDKRQKYIDIVIVGGGPTGVELAGSLAEMKRYIVPKDYNELDHEEIDIYLVQAGDRLLEGMSDHAAEKALQFLQKLGVKVKLNSIVESVSSDHVELKGGEKITARKVIWAAGVKARNVSGLEDAVLERGGRIKVDKYCQVVNYENIYAIGDIAYLEEEDYPKGHPQVAQVALQMGAFVAQRLKGKTSKSFHYLDKGSMATIGRAKAVVDLPFYSFSGFFAWIVWLLVHVAALIGIRNRLIVIFNWFWNYIRYDQSLRLIIRADERPGERDEK